MTFDGKFDDVKVIKNMIINKDEIHNCLSDPELDIHFKYEIIKNYVELNEIINSINITNNQRDIMTLIINGFSYSEIGRMTNRNRNTVYEAFERLCNNIADEKKRRAGERGV